MVTFWAAAVISSSPTSSSQNIRHLNPGKSHSYFLVQLREKVCPKKPMQLEEYFEVFEPDDIRIKGHRIGIEDVINYHLKGYTSQQILEQLPTLNLEKIYATLTYYYQNKPQIDAYLQRLHDWQEEQYQQWLNTERSPLIQRLRQLKAQRERQAITLP